MKDTLRVRPNERVDISDFEYLANSSIADSVIETANQFFCNPGVYDKTVLSGFDMTNPSGSQVCVDLGKAILHKRFNGAVVKSVLTASGDSSKTVDISSYPDATYGIYIRFESIAGDPEGRIFWNPTGTGTEYTQTMETRYIANWGLRLETSIPGEEWLRIGTVVKPSMVITDMRDFYFEGKVDDLYQSGWSTEGGGDATDRNVDRASYGVGDLHTFVAAIKQCVEDVKGRTLRSWYSKGIGGMNIGFDTDPLEGVLAIGDTDFYLKLVSGITDIAYLNMDSDASLNYDRTAKKYTFTSTSADQLILSESTLYSNDLGLGIPSAHWNDFYVDDTNVYGNQNISCCSDDTAPTTSNQRTDTINAVVASSLYTDGNTGAMLSRKSTYAYDTGTARIAKKQCLVEGLQAITEIDHTTDPGDTLENSMYIGSGVATIGGQDAFIYGSVGDAIPLSDLWDGDAKGGLTTETKTYLTSTTEGYENCLWMYIWLRSDGTFWFEPFGPNIKSDLPWTVDRGRYVPRTESGLPQTGFNIIDYLLVDVCWLVYGKEKSSGVTSNTVNFSSAIYMGNGARMLERSKYSNSVTIAPWFYDTTTGLVAQTNEISLNYVDSTDRHKRSPGIPTVSRRARIAIMGKAAMNTSAVTEIYIGKTSASTKDTNIDLAPASNISLIDAAAFSFYKENNSASSETHYFSGIVDVDVSHALDGTTGLYNQNIIVEELNTGTVTLSLNLQLLGFYWNRHERDILSFSMA